MDRRLEQLANQLFFESNTSTVRGFNGARVVTVGNVSVVDDRSGGKKVTYKSKDPKSKPLEEYVGVNEVHESAVSLVAGDMSKYPDLYMHLLQK